MSFKDLLLLPEILRAIHDEGYFEPTSVQAKAIPVVLSGQDVLVSAQTGTGKTAGFTLPMLQQLQCKTVSKTPRSVRALILTPTRELAAQVEESVRTYGKYLPFQSATAFGGVSIQGQIKRLRKGIDILVATPGRLIDLMNQRAVDLSKVEIFVLDEADRMLDMGFVPSIRKIIQVMPKNRQNMLFCATYSDEIVSLVKGLLKSPVRIETEKRNSAAQSIEQMIHPVDSCRKKELLCHLINTNDLQQVLIFTRMKHSANKLSGQLEDDGITSAAIHSNKSQAARTKALKDFKAGKVRALVATDIAARGLDIDQLPYVINYELPEAAEDYVHRIGRTGRAGSKGNAISLVCVDEQDILHKIERLLNYKLTITTVDGFEVDPKIKAKPIRRPFSRKSSGRQSQRPRKRSNSRNSRRG